MTILDIIIVLPLVGILAIVLGLPMRLSALFATGANVVLGLIVYFQYDRGEGAEAFQFTTSRVLLDSPQLSLAFGVDGMSVVMMLLSVIVTFCAIWLGRAPTKIETNARMYYICPLLISTGVLGSFLSTDLFFFYAFHELALIPTFLMIGMMGHGEDRVDVAWKVTIYLALGSLVLLVGIIALMIAMGGQTFDMITLLEAASNGALDAETQRWICALLLIGFGTLISLFPFHSWAAPAYAAAPTPIAMLHAGVLKKFGLYGILRVAIPMLPEGMQSWETWLLIMLLGNILYVGYITIAQTRLDQMLGYSSVMHMGYVFLGIVAYNQIGLNGALLLMFAHGISVALLFGLVGQMRNQLKSLDFDSMGGLGAGAPFYCFTFALAAFASIGLPGFANFTSELMIFFGAFEGSAGQIGALQITTMLALWGVVISAVYMLRGFRRVFQGESVNGWTLQDMAVGNRLPVCLLIAILLAVGCYPRLILDLLPASVEMMISQR